MSSNTPKSDSGQQEQAPPSRRFDVDVPTHATEKGTHPQGGQMINASMTGFRLQFSQPQVHFGKKGVVSIALALPPQGMVKVRAHVVWVNFNDRTAGFEIVDTHPAYEAYIRSLDSQAA